MIAIYHIINVKGHLLKQAKLVGLEWSVFSRTNSCKSCKIRDLATRFRGQSGGAKSSNPKILRKKKSSICISFYLFPIKSIFFFFFFFLLDKIEYASKGESLIRCSIKVNVIARLMYKWMIETKHTKGKDKNKNGNVSFAIMLLTLKNTALKWNKAYW